MVQIYSSSASLFAILFLFPIWTQYSGKVLLEQEGEAATPAKASCCPEELTADIKAKIEEEAYNKG